MYRSFRSLLAAAALMASLPVLAQASESQSDCVRINQVRAFTVESDTSVLVRQGKGQFRRITVTEGCPIPRADRIGFAFGGQQLSTLGTGGRQIPVTTSGIQNRFCSASPHAYVTFIRDNDDQRERCRIQSIETIDRETFEASGTVRDNRH